MLVGFCAHVSRFNQCEILYTWKLQPGWGRRQIVALLFHFFDLLVLLHVWHEGLDEGVLQERHYRRPVMHIGFAEAAVMGILAASWSCG